MDAGNNSPVESGTKPDTPSSATEAYEQALEARRPSVYILVLYVAGTAPRSLRAIRQARKLCDDYLDGCHDLEIIDIYQQPALADADGILAVPALIKKQPLPEQRFIGDMTDFRRVVDGLGLPLPSVGGDAR
jgi:hypothetical protein